MSFEGFLGVTYLWGSVLAVGGGLPGMALLGLAWSPVAGAISWWLARRRGLHGKRFAVSGAAYSVLFLGPWIYFAMRLLGRTPPRWIIGFSYAILYMVWSMPIFLMALLYNLTHDDLDIESDFYGITYMESTLYGFIWVASLGLLLTSLLVLTLSGRFERLQGSGVLIGTGYIMPFIGLWASTVAVVVYFWGPTPVLSYLQALGRSFGWW